MQKINKEIWLGETFRPFEKWIALGALTTGCIGAAGTHVSGLSTLTGMWGCTSQRGASATHAYTRLSESGLAMTNIITMPDGSRRGWQETYALAGDKWTLQIRIPQSSYTFDGTANVPDATWVFNGLEKPAQGDPHDARLTYAFDDADKFHRTWEKKLDGNWRTTSVEVCTKTN